MSCLADRFRDQTDPEHRFPGLVEHLHLPFGILLQAARDAAEEVAAHLGHLGPGGLAVFEFCPLIRRTRVVTMADPEKIKRHGSTLMLAAPDRLPTLIAGCYQRMKSPSR